MYCCVVARGGRCRYRPKFYKGRRGFGVPHQVGGSEDKGRVLSLRERVFRGVRLRRRSVSTSYPQTFFFLFITLKPRVE